MKEANWCSGCFAYTIFAHLYVVGLLSMEVEYVVRASTCMFCLSQYLSILAKSFSKLEWKCAPQYE